jgi:hypothetical protein
MAPSATGSGFVLINLHEGVKLLQIDLFADQRSRSYSVLVPVPGLRANYKESKVFRERLLATRMLVDYADDAAFREMLEAMPCCVTNRDGSKNGDPLNLAQDRRAFDDVVRRSSLLAGITGLLLALGWWLFGEAAVEFMVRSHEVQRQAVAVLPYAALYVALSAAAFQLDGIFIGATLTREMRNASFYSFAGFLAIGWPLVNVLQSEGLWVAFTTYVVLRAITLGIVYRRLPIDVSCAGSPAR